MVAEKRISQRKACRGTGLSRNSMAEPGALNEKDQPLRDRINAVAKRYKHWGVLKIHRKLRKQGETANHKRVRRLYRLAGLTLLRKVKKRLPEAVRRPLPKAIACNGWWALDFTSDRLADGRKFRTLNVLDDDKGTGHPAGRVGYRGRLLFTCSTGDPAPGSVSGTTW